MLKTQAIVFRITRYRESSLIFDAFTEAAGLQSFIASGVYSKTGQRLASALQPMHQLELVAYYHENKELHRLREVSSVFPYTSIPFDIRKSALGLFLLELCRKCIRPHHVNPSLFRFVCGAFQELDQHEFDPNYHLRFMLDFAAQLGFQPQNNHSASLNSFDLANGVFVPYDGVSPYRVDPESSRLLSGWMHGSLSASGVHNSRQRRNLLQLLLLYYQLHIEQFGSVKSVDVFHDILSGPPPS
ncbi:MAG: DNA repair protein RecO [Saprospiraceae bacterium]|nr:DNA repair protein RecO [Saprospiraceae bacterium]